MSILAAALLWASCLGSPPARPDGSTGTGGAAGISTGGSSGGATGGSSGGIGGAPVGAGGSGGSGGQGGGSGGRTGGSGGASGTGGTGAGSGGARGGGGTGGGSGGLSGSGGTGGGLGGLSGSGGACTITSLDTDHDGVPDCMDRCPADAFKTAAGVCGCTLPDSAAPTCLAHRYSFNGTGTIVVDSVNPGGNSAAVGTTLTGSGLATLAGGATDQYINLPPGLVSPFDNVTYEVWATWNGPATTTGTRIFDFGSSDAGPGNQGNGATYLYLTPRNSTTQVLRVAFSTAGIGGEAIVNGPTALTTNVMHHLAVVISRTPATMSLYLDGSLVGQTNLIGTTAGINDVNDWLGRSQGLADPEFGGTIAELRVFGAARTATQIMASFVAGPDALPAP